MKPKSFFVVVFVVLLALAVGAGIVTAQGPAGGVRAPRAAMGTAFTYQGQLKSSGSPVNGTCDFQFELYDDASVGTQIGATQTASSVTVTNGYFTVNTLDFGSDAFKGEARWLKIFVRCPAGSGSYTALSPRQQLTPAPYALALPGLFTQQHATSPNLIGGYSGNSVTSGVYGATIGGGGASGVTNRVTDNYGTVGGGRSNQAGDGTGTTSDKSYATVGGGIGNTASNDSATVSGGAGNTASGYAATVNGGTGNTASGNYATVGGGSINTASNEYATIGGGDSNTASAYNTTVGGGHGNNASNSSATVGGGYGNTASGAGAFVGGGGYDGTYFKSNVASGNASTIGGGAGHVASGLLATVSGGDSNSASGDFAFVGGGSGNTASNDRSTVSGGDGNTASGYYATVGGGGSNTASGYYSTVPGGAHNTAAGDYNLAAGRRAQANYWGTFVWGDSTDADFASTAPNQFLIRAGGGVGINTNSTSNTALTVIGTKSTSSDNTATFGNTALDPTNSRRSHIHWGTTGDWYIRSASTSGKVILQDGGGTVVIGTLGGAGATTLCRNASNEIATCASSLRYKDNIAALDLGLAAVAQLRPVTFDWKGTGEHDLGFVAEEVNAVAPVLTTRNADGQIEGVKYDRLTAVLVKATQEQQQQIAELKKQNELLAARVAELEHGAPAREANVSNAIAFGAVLVSIFALYRARKASAR